MPKSAAGGSRPAAANATAATKASKKAKKKTAAAKAAKPSITNKADVRVVASSSAVDAAAASRSGAKTAAQTIQDNWSHALVASHARRWCRSFVARDPRHQILEYFKPGDGRGPLGYLHDHHVAAQGPPSSFFSVWRPTSLKAIKMMMHGSATGKGLNIKGKSAKGGVLSGFVPFLQISTEAHKRAVPLAPRSARVRVYFKTAAARDEVVAQLQPICGAMVEAARQANATLAAEAAGRVPRMSDAEREGVFKRANDNAMEFNFSPMEALDAFAPDAYGVELPERLLWEGYVARADIREAPGWETGRPSMVAFMEANSKLGLKEVRGIDERMADLGLSHATVVLQGSVTPPAKVMVDKMRGQGHFVEIFNLPELMFNLPDHQSVPAHRLLTPKEREAVFERYGANSLPRMLLTDPVSRYYGLKRGQVMEIERVNASGFHKVYRIAI